MKRRVAMTSLNVDEGKRYFLSKKGVSPGVEFVDRAGNSVKILHRVLSFDGGGIRGLYQAKLLERLAEHGVDVVSTADILAGTSTGAIVAAALAIGMSPSQIAKLYDTLGPAVFPKSNWWSRKTKLLGRASYSSEVLRRALEESPLGSYQLNGCQKRLIIAAMSLTTHRLDTFDSASDDAHTLKLVDVLLASTAAPTYFEPAKVGDVYYVDGGLCCNNPAFRAVALLAAQHVPLDRIYVLSISTAGTPVARDGAASVGLRQYGWARPAIDLAMSGSSSVAARDCRLVGHHYRVEEDLEHVIELDDYAAAKRLLPGLAQARAVDALTREGIAKWLAGPARTGDDFAGRWTGTYSWTQPDGTVSETPEKLNVIQSGDLVYGEVESEWPYKFWGRVYVNVLIGEWTGSELRGSFFLTRNRESNTVAGDWVGTGDTKPYKGTWVWSEREDNR
jgi:uncharacterized protein